MRTSAALLAVLATADRCYGAENAPVVNDNPIDVIYTATLPPAPFFQAPGLTGNIKGFISASAPPDGVGVRFTVRLENFPKTGGPFPYHLHLNKAAGGSCASAGPHLDPTGRGDKPPCDAGNEPSCQVGDLAGKYGRINSDPFTAEYVDRYLSLKEGDAAFFGNRSFVIHLANTTRITCADFVQLGGNLPGVGVSASGGNSTYALAGNATSTTVLPVSNSSTAVTVGEPTPTRRPSGGGDDGCTSDNGDKPECAFASGSLPGRPTLGTSPGSDARPAPTAAIAAAGVMTPWSPACWLCTMALLVGVL